MDTPQEKQYQEIMGAEALERQKRLAAERHTCCGVIKPNHSPLCQWRKKT